MKYKKCKTCGQYIRNTYGQRKKEVIIELCDLLDWDKDTWHWKIQNTPLNYDMLADIVNALQKGEPNGTRKRPSKVG